MTASVRDVSFKDDAHRIGQAILEAEGARNRDFYGVSDFGRRIATNEGRAEPPELGVKAACGNVEI